MVSSKNSDMMASMPTRARITVSKGAAGNVMLVLNSNICRYFNIGKEKRTIDFVYIKPVVGQR